MTRELALPALSLVLMVGISGSGKSTFSSRHFAPTEVISSDVCRGLVCDDENDQTVTPQAFELLRHVVDLRLAAGRLTVVDATNVEPDARRGLIALAKEHNVPPVAIVLDPPLQLCVERSAARPDRAVHEGVLKRQHDRLRRSLGALKGEGIGIVHVVTDPHADMRMVRTRPANDLTDQRGPFDVIGDVHGCRAELESLLGNLGYGIARDRAGRPIGAHHDQRRAVFVGDLVDRGPDTPGVLRLVMGMVEAGDAVCVAGNHEAKLARSLSGRQVNPSHGHAETMQQLAAEPEEFRAAVHRFVDGLSDHYRLDGGRLVVAHAGLIERYHGRTSHRVRAFCLYGQTTGETDEYGLPVRLPWALDYRGTAMVVYGHTPVAEAEWVNHTICVDTGCVFGGWLTALRYPERELVSVPAAMVYYASPRPFPVNSRAESSSG